MDPLTMLIIGIGTQVIGGITSAAGSISQSESAAKDLEFNADILDKNADSLSRDIGEVRRQTADEVRQQRIIARKTIGATRAAYGASGVTTEGSALDVLYESVANAEMDTYNIERTGRTKEGSVRGQIDELKEKSKYYRDSAGRTRTGGYISAAGTLLGTAGKVISQLPTSGGMSRTA